MIQEIIGIMLLGIVSDILVTLYYISVGKLQAVPASLLTVLITLLNFFIIEKAVVNMNVVLIASYAFGCAIGCFAIITMQKKKLFRLKNNTAKKK
jgi:hypothetical protein